MPQLYVNPANAAINIISKLSRDLRASDLPPSTQFAMVQDLADVAELFEEMEHLAGMNEQPVRRWLRLVRS